MVKNAAKDWRQKEKGMTEDEMVGWHHQLSGRKFEQGLGDGNGQGSLVCCSPRGHKELDTTEWLNNCTLKLAQSHVKFFNTHILVQSKKKAAKCSAALGVVGRRNGVSRLELSVPNLCWGEGNGTPPQYSCLENPRDGGAWLAAIYGVAQSRTWLKRLSSSSSSSNLCWIQVDHLPAQAPRDLPHRGLGSFPGGLEQNVLAKLNRKATGEKET